MMMSEWGRSAPLPPPFLSLIFCKICRWRYGPIDAFHVLGSTNATTVSVVCAHRQWPDPAVAKSRDALRQVAERENVSFVLSVKIPPRSPGVRGP